ncbi:hypothetical protein F4810DRAFT_111985 [Camillea tinctor]|nr:hypothetical protein F4810DRAFT_111985 [Camillea tinctor]
MICSCLACIYMMIEGTYLAAQQTQKSVNCFFPFGAWGTFTAPVEAPRKKQHVRQGKKGDVDHWATFFSHSIALSVSYQLWVIGYRSTASCSSGIVPMQGALVKREGKTRQFRREEKVRESVCPSRTYLAATTLSFLPLSDTATGSHSEASPIRTKLQEEKKRGFTAFPPSRYTTLPYKPYSSTGDTVRTLAPSIDLFMRPTFSFQGAW